jgi:hypothetical protein
VKASRRQLADLPLVVERWAILPRRFLWQVSPSECGPHGSDERVGVAGEEVDPFGCCRRYLAECCVQGAEVASEPVIRRWRRERGELLDGRRLALRRDASAVFACDLAELGVPAVVEVPIEVGCCPGASVPGDDVAQDFEAIASCPAVDGHRDFDWPGALHLTARLDVLRRAESALGLAQLSEQLRIDGESHVA